MAKLINEKTGKEVVKGDKVISFRNEEYILDSFTEPHKVSSTGKVYVTPVGDGMRRGLYPSVFGLKIIDHQFSDELEKLLSSDKVIVSVVGR